ncbi:phage head completion protein, partial [Acinetobacter baumannii]|uniref:phage head completion protein n=1 Tax=Acinetobacter baumannii TaxID=470 RepID=UPI003316E8AD
MKIESGKLDHKLDVYRATTSREPGGQITKSWLKLGTVYAQRLEMRVIDSARAGQRDTYAIGRFLIRSRDITT